MGYQDRPVWVKESEMPKSKTVSATVYKEPISVSIEKLANGFLISSYRDTGTMKEIAKTLKEAQVIQAKILGKSPNAKT